MPEFSQPTLGLVRRILERLLPESALTPHDRRQFWKAKLFDFGFSPKFIDLASSAYSFNWTEIIPDLFVGKFGDKNSHFGQTMPTYFTENALKKLVVFALKEGKDLGLLKNLRQLLRADGFDISTDISSLEAGRNMVPELSPTQEQADVLHEATVETSNQISIFISHSSLDKEIADALTELLKNALEIDPRAIRCTSVEGHRQPVGARTGEHLKQELLNAKTFVALLTQHSLSSTWVLFELGARWSVNRHLAPLLAAGLTADKLGGPLPDINALSCDSDSDLHQFVHDLAEVLHVVVRKPALYTRYLTNLKNLSLSEAQQRRQL